MSRALAAAAALLVVLPASAAQASAGSSCADPLRWHLTDQQVAKIDSTFGQTLHHGHVTVTSDGGDPYGGTIFRAQAGGSWRICAVRGTYRNGHTFGQPGTVGHGSFATRRFLRGSPHSARSVVVSYAHRAGSDGSSCAHPFVVYERAGTDGQGDGGARIRTSFSRSNDGGANLTAQWQAATGSHVCEVAGWNSHGHAWHVTGGGDGHHALYRHASIGNHDNSGLYLWIAYRRAPSARAAASGTNFSLRGYANNVRVVKPLVGPWQLGTAHIRGSGTLGPGSAMDGTIRANTEPKYSRYKPASLRAQVVGYRIETAAHNTARRIILTIEVVSVSNGGRDCAPGVRGRLDILDSKAKIDNGQPRDWIIMGHWDGDRCPTFVQGWTNEDGGPRTSPQRGGPPDGGQWAIVKAL